MPSLFNIDLEKFLETNKKKYKPEWNKYCAEFEYLISFLSEDSIFTERKYSEDYREYLSESFGVKLVTSLNTPVKPWVQGIYNLELQRSINSRFFSAKIFNRLNDHSSIEICENKDLEEGYIYKKNYSSSGDGNFIYPRDEKKIVKVLKKENLLKEKLLDRDLDLSFLYLNEKWISYECEVDNFFQYKGSLIGPPSELMDSKLESVLDQIKEELQGFEGLINIDAFLYQSKLHFCEVNNRKTMGYFACKLKERFFPNYSYTKLILVRSRDIKQNIYLLAETLGEQVLSLSPKGNIFSLFLIADNHSSGIDKKVKELIDYLES